MSPSHTAAKSVYLCFVHFIIKHCSSINFGHIFSSVIMENIFHSGLDGTRMLYTIASCFHTFKEKWNHVRFYTSPAARNLDIFAASFVNLSKNGAVECERR